MQQPLVNKNDPNSDYEMSQWLQTVSNQNHSNPIGIPNSNPNIPTIHFDSHHDDQNLQGAFASSFHSNVGSYHSDISHHSFHNDLTTSNMIPIAGTAPIQISINSHSPHSPHSPLMTAPQLGVSPTDALLPGLVQQHHENDMLNYLSASPQGNHHQHHQHQHHQHQNMGMNQGMLSPVLNGTVGSPQYSNFSGDNLLSDSGLDPNFNLGPSSYHSDHFPTDHAAHMSNSMNNLSINDLPPGYNPFLNPNVNQVSPGHSPLGSSVHSPQQATFDFGLHQNNVGVSSLELLGGMMDPMNIYLNSIEHHGTSPGHPPSHFLGTSPGNGSHYGGEALSPLNVSSPPHFGGNYSDHSNTSPNQATFNMMSNTHQGVYHDNEEDSDEREDGLTEDGKRQSKKYPCRFQGCNRAFAKSYNLRTHFLTHFPNRVKQYVCPLCGRGFDRNHDLGRHLKSRRHIAKHGHFPFPDPKPRNSNTDTGGGAEYNQGDFTIKEE